MFGPVCPWRVQPVRSLVDTQRPEHLIGGCGGCVFLQGMAHAARVCTGGACVRCARAGHRWIHGRQNSSVVTLPGFFFVLT
mmetsp:Transcript_49830/g.82003  ORF Transcript_49830/g.82003 Transcript_49830/m.82003 type:complete len:81 (+) Transcript_49830:101-343(+)